MTFHALLNAKLTEVYAHFFILSHIQHPAAYINRNSKIQVCFVFNRMVNNAHSQESRPIYQPLEGTKNKKIKGK